MVVEVHLCSCEPIEAAEPIVEYGSLGIVILGVAVSGSCLYQVIADDGPHTQICLTRRVL